MSTTVYYEHGATISRLPLREVFPLARVNPLRWFVRRGADYIGDFKTLREAREFAALYDADARKLEASTPAEGAQ